MNQTDPFAESIHGTNPQNLIEKITRLKIYNCNYWKEQCFGITSESIVDKAVALKYAGGTYAGNVKPTRFLCLILKMLQLQPEKEIVLEYIQNEDVSLSTISLISLSHLSSYLVLISLIVLLSCD